MDPSRARVKRILRHRGREILKRPAWLAPPRPWGSSMKLVTTPVLVFVCAIALFAVSTPARQQGPIRSGARTVAVYATVTDAQGRLVPDLTREAFEIYDNGKLQATTVFSSDIQPITVV